MDGESSVEAVLAVESFGITKNDINEIWQKYFALQDVASRPLAVSVPIHARVRPFATNRVGYLGDHFILELRRSEHGTDDDKVELFLKMLPTAIPALNEYLQSIGTGRKESNVYRNLLSSMRQFSRFAPQCFLSSDPDGRVIVLENLHAQGFRTIASAASTGIFDLEHLKCALVALARFHSASMLLEKKTGTSLPLLAPGVLDENAWVRRENNPRMKELDNAIDVLLALVRVIEKDNPRLETILQKLPPFILNIYELVKPSHNHRNVACHGDLWASNLMFQYDVTNTRVRVPVQCLIVDYQFTRYAPPAYDVNMLITLTTTGQFRRTHRDELIRFYYQRIMEELKGHPSVCPVPEELLPAKPFFESCDVYRTSGLIDNFLMNHVTLLPRTCVNKIFSSPECYNSFSGEAKIEMCLEVLNTDRVYRERVAGIVSDLIEAL